MASAYSAPHAGPAWIINVIRRGVAGGVAGTGLAVILVVVLILSCLPHSRHQNSPPKRAIGSVGNYEHQTEGFDEEKAEGAGHASPIVSIGITVEAHARPAACIKHAWKDIGGGITSSRFTINKRPGFSMIPRMKS